MICDTTVTDCVHDVDGGHVKCIREALIYDILVVSKRGQHITHGRAEEKQDWSLEGAEKKREDELECNIR